MNDKTPDNDLKLRLYEQDAFIQTLIDTIPPKLYFDDNEVLEMVISKKHAAMDEAAKMITKGKQELSSRNKHKRARLDPLQHKSVSQIQQEVEKITKNPKKKKKDDPSVSLTRAANIEELRKRLEVRIQLLQKKRRGCSDTQFQEKKRLRRKMKRKEKMKQKGNLNKLPLDKKTITEKNPTETKKSQKNEKPKPVYNKEGKMIYSKFDFMNSNESESKKKTGKNYKELLQHAERDQDKIEEMKQQDPESASALVKKKVWQQALQKAEGIKLKDDPVLLKKSLKKLEKKKNKSSKQWQQRKDHTHKMMKTKQDKRKGNLQKRKKEKFDKKIKQAKKKGRIIPGF